MVKCCYCDADAEVGKRECGECSGIFDILCTSVFRRISIGSDVRVTYIVIKIDHDGDCPGEDLFHSESTFTIDLPLPAKIRQLISRTPSEEEDDNNEDPFVDVQLERVDEDTALEILQRYRQRKGLALNPMFRNFYRFYDRDFHRNCYGGVDYIPVDAVLL